MHNSISWCMFTKVNFVAVLTFLKWFLKCDSKVALNVSVSVFKGFLSRAYKICSERYLDEEIPFLIDVFTENGSEKKHWKR